ncbi:hypothetical protein RD792_014705 [Penstemon davidsonii]|uniref:DYW domain-containing protein n=1 Tax=Penstemon davidsonii TaxID=160366 RepID=A0ABR0CQ18_9LAMI|nr:hypothetical protein RD792_014705 [Penstemon davidsonii]
MYTRRGALVTYNSLRPILKLCRSRTPDFLYSINAPGSIRNLAIATERSDVYNTFDENVAESHSGYNNLHQNDRFYGRYSAGVEQNQNPSRVYGQSLKRQDSDFATGSLGSYNYFDGKRAVNQSNHSYGNQNGSFYGNLGGVEQGLNSSGLNGQNANYTYDRGDGIFDYRVPGDMNSRGESVEVGEGSRSRRKVEDLDELSKEGKLKEAVELLGLLEQDSLEVDLPRYLALMKACGENEALEEAKSVHEHLLKLMGHIDVRTYNKILEMYSECGSMENALAVFHKMPKRNLTSWDIMIFWLAKNGFGEDSIELFEEFKRSGLKPDGQMFIGVFFACGVLCDTIEGMLHFESMVKDYGIVPAIEHYVSIVGMLGIAGCLDEALEFIEKMPIEPSVDIWETLMNYCRIHGNLELGNRCAELVEHLDSSRLNEQSREGLIPINASDLDRERVKKKLSSQNLLDVRSRVHEYRAGDRSHPDNERIYTLLRGLKEQMKDVGYVPETKFVLHDVDQETKEEALMAHSERLAAAQGFLTSAARHPLRIIKNLRVCGDCHNAFKIISKIVGRQIIARDSKRFHHFENGSCSCNDYW